MAKLNAPLFALRAVGTLAKQLTVRNRNGVAIAETKPIPKDAKTSSQLAWRTMYHLATQLWHDLTLAEKAVWETLARPRHMTGYAYFMSQALRPNPGIYLPLLGGTMQGQINMAGFNILNLPYPPLEVLTQTVVTNSAVDYVDFTSLDISTDRAYSLLASIKNPLGSAQNYFLYCNGDYANVNYNRQTLSATGTTVTATAADYPSIMYCPANQSTPVLEYVFQDQDGYFRTIGIRPSGRASYVAIALHSVNSLAVKANITSLRIKAETASGIGIGSWLQLYRARPS